MMRLSLDTILEYLGDEAARRGEGLSCMVFAREERRGISGIRLVERGDAANTQLDDETLYIIPVGLLPRLTCPLGGCHLAVVSPNELTSLPSAAEVGVIVTYLDTVHVFALAVEAFDHLARWDARMIGAVLACKSPLDVLQVAAEEYGNPIALVDDTLAYVGYAGELPEGPTGTIWDDVISKGYTPMEYFTRAERLAISSRSGGGAWPLMLTPERNPEGIGVIATMYCDGNEVGSLGIVQLKVPFTPGQIGLVDLIRERVEAAFGIMRDERDNPTRFVDSHLLADLYNGRLVDDRVLARHLGLRGWVEGVAYRLLVVGYAEQGSYFFESVADRLHARFPKAATALVGGDLVMLFCSADYPVDEGEFVQKLDTTARELGLLCMLSSRFEDLEELADLRCQCELAQLAAPRSDGFGVMCADKVYEQLLSHVLLESVPGATMCDTRVLDLVRKGYRGDVARGAEMVRDLYVYLLHGANAFHAARLLFIHRNTLIYRLERLEELLGCSFSDIPDWKIMQLEVSCLVALRLANEH